MIQNYLKYDKVTRFEMNHKQFNPNILLTSVPEVYNLKKIFPEIRQDNNYIKVMKINDIDVRKRKMRRIISKYLFKLINELRFKEFLDITYGKNFIKSCKVFKNKQAFNCSESKYGIYKYYDTIDSLTFNIIFENKTNSLYENNFCFAGSLDKIELELNETELMSVYLTREPFLVSQNFFNEV
jgi:hypothetical protein